jgi:hypothetical protein
MQAPRTAEHSFTLDELPEVITAKHISGHLHITTQQAYVMMKMKEEAGGILSFRIGKPIRAYKTDYIKWLERRKPKEWMNT